jgi:hypothetical protein
MLTRFILFIVLLSCGWRAGAQQRLGINNNNPQKILDVSGAGDRHIRVHNTSTGFGAEAGIEFVRGPIANSAFDWKILNDAGQFKIKYGDNNFTGAESEALRINGSLLTGIGSNSPNSKLNIDNGTLIAFGGDGYLKTGSENGLNLAFDNTQILALDNGAPSTLSLQANGGNTHFGLNGGNTYMAIGSGRVGVGTTTLDVALNIADSDFQLHVDNDSDDANHWHIGASGDAWAAGDNQLLFSPTTSSNNAIFRLMDISDNDGNNAPVMIHTTADHTILLDGNEIDTRGTPLYINHNTDENTYINPTGGRVGIGTTNPQAMLHLYATSGDILTLENGNWTWHFTPNNFGDGDFQIYWDDFASAFATIDGTTGQWTNISDQNAKENIALLGSVLEKLMLLNTYHYSFKKDSLHQLMTGIIAQEALPLFPEIVSENEGQYGVSYGQLAAIGIKAIQEQQVMIDELKSKVVLLRKKLEEKQNPAAINTPEKTNAQ